MPNVSELRERIYFDVRNDIPDGYGNVQSTFVEQFSRLAKVRPRLGGETVIAGRLQGRKFVDVTVRSDDQTVRVLPDWRARDVRGEIYNIKSIVDPFEHTADHNRWIEILCEVGGQVA